LALTCQLFASTVVHCFSLLDGYDHIEWINLTDTDGEEEEDKTDKDDSYVVDLNTILRPIQATIFEKNGSMGFWLSSIPDISTPPPETTLM